MPGHTLLLAAARSTALCVAAGLLAAPASGQNSVVINKTLLGSAAHKECLSVSDRQAIRYWYRAEAPVDFNINYVEGAETVYPVRRDRLAMGSGSFAPKTARDYCMVWTNAGKHPILFRVEFARLPR
jgi:hypothetical protein